MRALRRTASIAVMLISLSGMAAAAEIRVLSVDAVQGAIKSLAADFAKDTGHHVMFTIGSPAVVMQKIKANDVHDLVIVTEPAMDRLDKDGIVNPESRVQLATTGLGVVVRAGAPVPDVSTPEAFRQALLAAKSIVHGDPALPHESGETAQAILAKAGILDAVKAKIQVAALAAGQELIAKGEVEIGLYHVSEIPQGNGLAFAGAVPAPLQIDTVYEGALTSDGSAVEAARDFINFLASAEARPKWVAARLEPLGDR